MKMYEKDNMLYFTREGEIVRLSACGKDSLRFQASPNCTISEQDFTLMPQNTTAEITISENQASIQNGALRADIYGWQVTIRFPRTVWYIPLPCGIT